MDDLGKLHSLVNELLSGINRNEHFREFNVIQCITMQNVMGKMR